MKPALRIALACLVTAAALGVLLEGSARLYLLGPGGIDPRRFNSVRRLHQLGFVQTSPYAGIRWELRPNLDGWANLVRLRTSSRGLRDREYDVEKPDGTFRVAVLGSSMTMPSGVEIEDAYHTRLEERYAREFGPGAYEFINFAVAGHVPHQVLATLRHRVAPYDPDLALFAVTDIIAGYLLGMETNPFVGLEFANPPNPRIQSFLLRLLEQRTRAPPAPAPRAPGEGAPPGSQPNLLRRLARIGRELGVPIVVIHLSFDRNRRSPVASELAREASARGLYYVDTLSAFDGTRGRDFWVHRLDPHPDARAHARFASVLDDFLRRNDLLER